MNIVISGDLYISDDYSAKKLFCENLLDLFHTADYRVVNLEMPLCDIKKTKRIIKTGPYLGAKPETVIPYLQKLGINLVTLANNHIFDYGIEGLQNTIDSLKANHISYVGAGMNIQEAQQSAVIKNGAKKIAFVNVAENEWASANEKTPGANPMDIIDNVKQIQKAKEESDIVIVIIHGGHEYYHLPSPRMIKQYRFYADSGASAVICHHSHCISGHEIHNHVPIFYGLGNFMFTIPSQHDLWYTGLILSMDIKEDLSINFELHPVSRDKQSQRAELLTGEEKSTVMKDFDHYSRIVSDDKLLKASWNQFIEEKKGQYLRPFSLTEHLPGKKVRGLLSRLRMDQKFLSKSNIQLLLNLIRCESHAELTKEILTQYLYENE